jgi:zinc transporter 9
MLVVEQILSPHSHDNSQPSPSSDLLTSDSSSDYESSCALAREDALEQGMGSPHSKNNSQHHCYQSLSSTSVASTSNSSSTCASPRREDRPGQNVESMHSRNGFRQAKPSETSPSRANKNRAYPLTLGLVLHALADGLALGSSVLSDSGSTKRSSIVFFALMVVSLLVIISVAQVTYKLP